MMFLDCPACLDPLGRLPDVQIEEWAGDGHFVHLVDPRRFATRLQTFVEHCDQAS